MSFRSFCSLAYCGEGCSEIGLSGVHWNQKVDFNGGGANRIRDCLNGLRDMTRNVFQLSDWLTFRRSQTVDRKYIKLDVKMCAVLDNGEAKLIKFDVSCAIQELLAINCWRREVLTFFARNFAVIG